MKVNSGIPVPPDARKKYPFDELEVGDSVEFDDTATFERARRAAQSFGRSHDMKFIARKGIQDGEFVGSGGTIWREA